MTALIVICVLLLLSYLLDISAQKTKIPAIFVLILIGIGLHQFAEVFYPELDNLINVNMLLPVIGNLGLVLIVLEGSIELELSRDKLSLISKSFLIALLSILLMAGILLYLINYLSVGYFSTKTLLLNIIPLTVISSAVAIPASKYMSLKIREFVIYESSLSDILGVLVFYFLLTNETINNNSFLQFGYDILIMILISFIISAGLSLFLSRIHHHIKFIPIIIVIVLVYSIAKLYHLPSLILILVFGLMLKNLEKLTHFEKLKSITQFIHPETLSRELKKFEDIVNEFSFLIRTVFFLLLGYSLDISDILNTSSLQWSLLIISVIYFVRTLLLMVFNLNIHPLLFISPRGLVSVLLFISIPLEQKLGIINNSVLIQVVLMSIIVMMIGSIFYKKEQI